MEAKQVPALIFIACFLCFVLFFPPSLKGLHSSGGWSSVGLSPFPFLFARVRRCSPAHGPPRAKSRKRHVKGFQPVCVWTQTPWRHIRHPQLLLVLGRTPVWSAANHPWTCPCPAAGTTRCGHKVSIISFECASSRTPQTLHDNPHTQ